MSPLIIHAIILIISGIITVFLTTTIFKTHKKTGYFLTIFIPICFLWGSVAIFSPELITPKPIDKIRLADSYIYEGKLDKAIELLIGISDEDEDEDINLKLSTAYFAKGLKYAENNNYNQALTYLLMALNTAPKDAHFLPDIKYFIDKIENLK